MVTTRPHLVIGILALQGAYDLHVDTLQSLSSREDFPTIDVVLAKKPQDLNDLDGIIIPGGESTVMEKLLGTSGLLEPLRAQLDSGLPVLGTCAGLILLANIFSVLDCEVERNSYGTQINSFETDVHCVPLYQSCRAYFIRAPKIVSVGENAHVLATADGETVGVWQGNALGIACHPEVAGSALFHQFFVEQILRRVKSHSHSE